MEQEQFKTIKIPICVKPDAWKDQVTQDVLGALEFVTLCKGLSFTAEDGNVYTVYDYIHEHAGEFFMREGWDWDKGFDWAV